MEISIKKILGWQRSSAGCTFFIEIEIGGTVQGTCRLILPTDAEVETMQKLLGEARADARRTRPGAEPPTSSDHQDPPGEVGPPAPTGIDPGL